MRHDEPAQSFTPGDVVFTTDDDYEREWWFNWPGVVRQVMASGREFLVEFMGFGTADKRQMVLPIGSIQHLEDPQVGARVSRIVQHFTIPDDGKRRGAAALPKIQPKVSVELPDDDLEDDDDILN